MCNKAGCRHKPAARCDHRNGSVKVGPYQLLVGGLQYFRFGDLDDADVLVPLHEPQRPGDFDTENCLTAAVERYTIVPLYLPDYGGLPDDWKQQVEEKVLAPLREGKKVKAYCIGSHGRTGTLIASLIYLLEPNTHDPIAAARKRHCRKSVETRKQAEGIFRLRRKAVPKKYDGTFHGDHKTAPAKA